MSEPFWTPLGGQPVDYEGAWSAGFQYAPGDVVVYNGVTYLAVNPSLGVAPPVSGYSFLDVGPEVAYAEIVAPVTVSATTFPTANTIITCPAFVADGNSDYLAEFYAPYLQAATGALYTTLWEDGVERGILTYSDAGRTFVGRATRKFRPAAGAHVYTLRASLSGAGGTPQVGAGPGGAAGTYFPAFLRVTKVPTALPVTGGAVPAVALVTALPASPVDGQECVLVDSLTAPTFQWHLRYVAAKASNRWVFVGGTPRVSAQSGSIATTSTAFVALTSGPTLVVPVAGSYLIEWEVQVTRSTAGADDLQHSILGSTSGSGATAPYGTFTTQFDSARVPGVEVMSLAAGETLSVRVKTTNGISGTFSLARIRLTPVAVGG